VSADPASGEPVWIKVAEAADVAEDSLREVEAAGKVLVLVSIAGHLSALDDRCPHWGGPLSAGSIENGLVVCPWHYREYDPRTGLCKGYSAAVSTYPVEVRGEGVFVRVPE
jgi:nitrite reductase/ring-hydroxylating ferredoxin subunit